MHCTSLFKKRQEDLLFKSYVADVVMAIANSTGKIEVKNRFIDLIPTYEEKVKEKTAEEIVADIMTRAELKFAEGE